MIIAIDLDHTILNRFGLPITGAKETIEFLIKQGHKPYILTARNKMDHKIQEKILTAYGFPQLEITNRKKLHTRVIIDDRAIRFTSWEDIGKYFGL